MQRYFLTVFCLGFSILTALGQTPAEIDSSVSRYYTTYRQHITARGFLSKKYTDVSLRGPRPFRTLHYRPNNAFNAGVGASYGAITLNLGFNLGFLDRKRDERGKTRFLDLQSHIYTRKWVIDLYGQFYKGYYLTPRGTAAAVDHPYYLRPDMDVMVLGTSVYRLLSPARFSYRAAFLQTEWQQRSAGSWLIGFEAYHGQVKGDSSLVPSLVAANYSQRDIHKLRFTELGPGIGYAYTAVWKRHFFITGSLSLNGDLSFVREYRDNTSQQKTSISPNISVRAVAGYNSHRWSIALSWVDQALNLRGPLSSHEYLIRTGNIRLTIAKRLQPGRRLRERLKPIE